MNMPLLRCRQVMPYLSAYVDGELDAEIREQVETHLASCPKCSREVARYQAIDGLLLSLPASRPSPEVLDRILASTSIQTKEKAIRQSLRQPERVLAPRSVPAFLAADTNLAAPVPSLRRLGGRRPSWILATGLPTLAAILIVAMSLVFFHVRTNHPSVTTPPPATNIEQVTNDHVDNLASQLPFTPVTPTDYPLVTGYQRATIGTFPGGTKYLEVDWNLRPPLTSLHLREVGVALADRRLYDYEPSLPNNLESNILLTWALPGYSQWQPMTNVTGSPGHWIVGADFDNGKFSVTLDIGTGGGRTPTFDESTALRNISLSMDVAYHTLSSVFEPASRSLVHYKIFTTGADNGKQYTWDVYWDDSRARAKASLYDGWHPLGALVYTDYQYGSQWTRCSPGSGCSQLLSLPSTDPFSLGTKASNFLTSGINSDIQNGELWNLGAETAPSVLGIGPVLVYALAFVDGPYPITVYVNRGMQVVGVLSQVGSPPPGGGGAASPLSAPAELSGNCSNAVAYPVIAYLPSGSQALTAPAPVGVNNTRSIDTCMQ